MAASFANLGITIGTLAGGSVIAIYKVEYLPFTAVLFGIAAAGMVLLRYLSDQRKSIKAVSK
jgi:predicted MFS family arabinose efflux permease